MDTIEFSWSLKLIIWKCGSTLLCGSTITNSYGKCKHLLAGEIVEENKRFNCKEEVMYL
jgi:hypothetical protein